MSKKTFDPAKWQPTEPNKIESQKSHNSAALSPSQKPNSDFLSPQGESTRRGIEVREGSGMRSDLELIVERIEAASVDIAPNYADWRDLALPSLRLWAKAVVTTITA